jgi:hypothetical protein
LSILNPANPIILDPGRPMRVRLEAAARQWTDTGRGAEGLLTGTAFFMAQCWLCASSGHPPQSSVSQDVRDFVAAGKAALGGDTGWNSLLSEKDFCRECHLSFHLENLGICTGCAEYVCGACREKHTRCAGEVVG